MPPPPPPRSAAGTCQYCGNKAGILSGDHPECRRTFEAGWNRMVELAADAARTHAFDEKALRLPLGENTGWPHPGRHDHPKRTKT